MKKLDEIRDGLAEQYWEYFCVENGYDHVKTVYAKGFNASTQHWQKIVGPLVEALEKISKSENEVESHSTGIKYKTGPTLDANRAIQALENYRKELE